MDYQRMQRRTQSSDVVHSLPRGDTPRPVHRQQRRSTVARRSIQVAAAAAKWWVELNRLSRAAATAAAAADSDGHGGDYYALGQWHDAIFCSAEDVNWCRVSVGAGRRSHYSAAGTIATRYVL